MMFWVYLLLQLHWNHNIALVNVYSTNNKILYYQKSVEALCTYDWLNGSIYSNICPLMINADSKFIDSNLYSKHHMSSSEKYLL